MKDTQLRGVVLAKFYEKTRRGGMYSPKDEDFSPPIPRDDLLAIAHQLGEHHLLDWQSQISKQRADSGRVIGGIGRINTFGIDVVEGEAVPSIKVEFVQNNVTITGSSGVIVGDHNTQNITHHITELAKAIDASQASPEHKEEAKGLLRKLVEHPLVTSIAGGVAGSLLG